MGLILSNNAKKVLEKRYLQRDASGRPTETPEELLRRVARGVASAEYRYGGGAAVRKWEERFFELLIRMDFLPNSPTLMNAGTGLGQLSACFVLPIEDDLGEIFDSLKLMAVVQKSGGGTGFSFSRLRPRGAYISSSGGKSSGPVSFMRIFNCATEYISQGGRRRGANMGILDVHHPDIMEFIKCKRDGRSFRNFNLSVAVSDAFMEAAFAGEKYELLNPRSKEPVRLLRADLVFREITKAAWKCGDPGLIFLDAINRVNPTPNLGRIEATNPCGEVPLLPFEACTLGSINLAHMLRRNPKGNEVDWDRLRETARLSTRFLDDVLDAGNWPDPRIARAVLGNRKVGLGVMGFAETLISLGLPYDSPEAITLAGEIMECIGSEAKVASEELAVERGVFPNWSDSVFARDGIRRRNASLTSIAPTGSISICANTSASIEPLFALAFVRHALEGESLPELNSLFLKHAKKRGFYTAGLVAQIVRSGRLTEIESVPNDVKSLFKTALEISPIHHLNIQRAFQRHVDNAVSKTINLPSSASITDVAKIYRQAWELGLKGVTIYRYGSKEVQVLEFGGGKNHLEREYLFRCDPAECRL